jgi:phosphate/sulfate permease
MVSIENIHHRTLARANKGTTVANAVGPWVASYNTYTSGEVIAKADTPIWILVTAGLLLGLGF